MFIYEKGISLSGLLVGNALSDDDLFCGYFNETPKSRRLLSFSAEEMKETSWNMNGNSLQYLAVSLSLICLLRAQLPQTQWTQLNKNAWLFFFPLTVSVISSKALHIISFCSRDVYFVQAADFVSLKQLFQAQGTTLTWG